MPIGKAQLGLPVALSIVCLVIGCSSNHSPSPEEARPVKTMVVAAGNSPTVRSFPGRVEASRMVDLAFQVSVYSSNCLFGKESESPRAP